MLTLKFLLGCINVLLCSPDSPGAHNVHQIGLDLTEPTYLCLLSARIKVCAIAPGHRFVSCYNCWCNSKHWFVLFFKKKIYLGWRDGSAVKG